MKLNVANVVYWRKKDGCELLVICGLNILSILQTLIVLLETVEAVVVVVLAMSGNKMKKLIFFPFIFLASCVPLPDMTEYKCDGESYKILTSSYTMAVSDNGYTIIEFLDTSGTVLKRQSCKSYEVVR